MNEGTQRGGARPAIAPPEEDPNAVVVCSSPPCFMHELDPSYLGYLGRDEVRELLEALLAMRWSGTVVEAAWVRAMLRRHLAHPGVTRPPGPSHVQGEATTGGAHAGSADGGEDCLRLRLRAALPRLADGALQRDLAEVLRMLERDLRRHGRTGDS
ncbi:hypothetical protein E2C06_24840 [Dankookia rubra]|uniref:Uncharacterized protein n=1 Tax=Dankookia rubra TaxID=1442381 RepID=A0A4R5QA73_9PROT|nr:hypothetical protein [Dankookia rubra]TDH59944.1 hypothetical protein E2C06_24840 [Dankookia rubra]